MADDNQTNPLYARLAAAGDAFSPAAPISRVTLFAGRHQQVTACIDIVYRRGQHGIIFGERGVGKTSLANLIADFISRGGSSSSDEMPRFLTPRVNCTASSDYDSIWRDVFGHVSRFEYTEESRIAVGTYADALSDKKLDPSTVQKILQSISEHKDLIVVIDEFDRLRDAKSRRLMADTLKALSDHSIGATIFFVGVGDTVDQLIAEHQSVTRAMMQVQMPRMTEEEIKEIFEKGLDRFNSKNQDFSLTFTNQALELLVTLSRGLPHYAHLLAQKACYVALERGEQEISTSQVMTGVYKALEELRQSALSSYDTAVYSAHKNATLCETLAACAIANTDRQGFFSPTDVRKPLERIRKRPLQIASFSQHLDDFCKPQRASVLQKTGDTRRVRYRFSDALMGPYVVIRAIVEDRITADALRTED